MSYVIAGRKIAAEYLSLATLGTVGGIVAVMKSRPAKPKPVPATENLSLSGSTEESDFIKNFIAEAEKEDAKKH
ncbi:hypothetical protein PIIN_10844 [Serendipita indica DSM 11827]|uniref:Uncharacterized protein n=1 Tax=Serendipita indica (strain DSM 11827) TaxID=1109443 RepID=G4TZW6_SERID|nr:hypothetical protein PIIN_10844 [Serendipita indica DSM 11827]